ncbi:hypothetical protein [Fulvimarina sp. MAC3]|uniref:hypothetical protein n=1 Tax=Fulvimarina sp. MAC3 TaxID=3148887 RepID=UPI0031FCC2BA
MTDGTPSIGLPYIMASQAQKHVTHNALIEAMWQTDADLKARVTALEGKSG